MFNYNYKSQWNYNNFWVSIYISCLQNLSQNIAKAISKHCVSILNDGLSLIHNNLMILFYLKHLMKTCALLLILRSEIIAYRFFVDYISTSWLKIIRKAGVYSLLLNLYNKTNIHESFFIIRKMIFCVHSYYAFFYQSNQDFVNRNSVEVLVDSQYYFIKVHKKVLNLR